MSKRVANGAGSVRKRTVNGTTFWECRVSAVDEMGLVKRIRHSTKTQREGVEWVQSIQAAIKKNANIYKEPTKITCEQWFNEWLNEYCVNIKPRSRDEYKRIIENNLLPYFGKIKLAELSPMQIQKVYNSMRNKRTGEPLSPKSIKCIHGVLHKCLQKAYDLDMIAKNPTEKTELPRQVKRDLTVFEDDNVKDFLKEIKGHKYEPLFKVALFTGMRESEICGLTWDEIDFKNSRITISHQLQKNPQTKIWSLVSTKNGKSRTIIVPDAVMEILRQCRKDQLHTALDAEDDWNNEMNLVFVHPEDGSHLYPHVVYLNFKKIAEQIGCPDMRFHDIRHSYATLSVKNGDPITSVQQSLGHATAAFTMEVYAHCTQQIQKESAQRMNEYIANLAEA